MALNLHTISAAKGSKKAKKRVGRGNSSGHGMTATRGQKGQKSRSGVSGLKLIGLKTVIRSTPKLRGFKSDKPKNQVVKIADINKKFKDGDSVSPKSLAKLGLIDTMALPVKVLGTGSLKLKNLNFEGVKVSESVKTQIEKEGGKIK